MKIMQYVPKDVVVEKLAINLDFNDIINYCKTSKKYNKIICNNNIFWHKYIHNKFNIKCESVDIKRLQNIAYWLDYLEKNNIPFKGIPEYQEPKKIFWWLDKFKEIKQLHLNGNTNMAIQKLVGLKSKIKKELILPVHPELLSDFEAFINDIIYYYEHERTDIAKFLLNEFLGSQNNNSFDNNFIKVMLTYGGF